MQSRNPFKIQRFNTRTRLVSLSVVIRALTSEICRPILQLHGCPKFIEISKHYVVMRMHLCTYGVYLSNNTMLLALICTIALRWFRKCYKSLKSIRWRAELLKSLYAHETKKNSINLVHAAHHFILEHFILRAFPFAHHFILLVSQWS